MRRNDPFNPPAAALERNDASLPRSSAKWHVLYPPERETGVPLGGIGAGGIMRSSTGAFSRWTIKGGGVKSFSAPAAGFVLRTRRPGAAPFARALQPQPEGDALSGFELSAPDRWHGLFPKAWHVHDANRHDDVTAECLSFSPVIPGDLKTASLPVALFRWRLTNHADTHVEAALAFLFPNLNGWFADFTETAPDRPPAGAFNRPLDEAETEGVILDRARAGDVLPESTGQWAIACPTGPGTETSRSICFDALRDGA